MGANYSVGSGSPFLKLSQMLWRMPVLQNLRSLFFPIDACMLHGMPHGTAQVRTKKQVLVMYNMALGDDVMFLGVAQSLRDVYPSSEYDLSIACQKGFSSLFEDMFDYVIPLDFSGSITNMGNRKKLFEQLRAVDYDFVIDPVGCEAATMNVFCTRAASARQKIGVLDTTLPRHQISDSRRAKVYTSVVKVDTHDLHLIEFYAEFLRKLGASSCVAHPATIPSIDLPFQVPQQFFIVFPAASMSIKSWPADRYAEIANRIYRKTGYPLMLCGTEHDRPAIQAMLQGVGKDVRIIDHIGQTNVPQFIELIGRSAYVVTNDTSAYHIAVAKQRTTFMLCGGYTYNRYAHYQYASLGYKDPALITHPMDCYNCNNYCTQGGADVFPCIDRITTDYAWSVIESTIDGECDDERR